MVPIAPVAEREPEACVRDDQCFALQDPVSVSL
jgi:hypothetical protein